MISSTLLFFFIQSDDFFDQFIRQHAGHEMILGMDQQDIDVLLFPPCFGYEQIRLRFVGQMDRLIGLGHQPVAFLEIPGTGLLQCLKGIRASISCVVNDCH